MEELLEWEKPLEIDSSSAFALSALDPDEVPINILVAKKGTPYSEMHSITSKDIIRTIAVWRFILPRAILKLAGG